MPRLTSGPPDAKINKDGFRMYEWLMPDGTVRKLMSVTSIRKLLGLPFPLVTWQNNKILDRALSPEFLARLLARTSDDAMELAEIRKWLRAASTEERDAAGSRGIDVHGAIELGLAPEDCNEQTRPYVAQVRHFLAETGWKIAAQEFQCWNLGEYGYAGTGDVIFETPDGQFVLGDWKTSKSVVVEHVVQLHAYLGGEFIGTAGKVDERLTAMLTATSSAGILHLNGKAPSDWTWYDVPFSETVLRAFFGSVAFAQLLAQHKTPDALFSGKRKGTALR